MTFKQICEITNISRSTLYRKLYEDKILDISNYLKCLTRWKQRVNLT